jgi:hypothetical protein
MAIFIDGGRKTGKDSVHPIHAMTRKFTILIAAFALFFAGAPQAQAEENVGPGAVLIDAVVVRPVGVVVTVVAAAAFVVALPFAAAAGQVPETAENLVARPARVMFCRPLGNFKKMRDDSVNHHPPRDH